MTERRKQDPEIKILLRLACVVLTAASIYVPWSINEWRTSLDKRFDAIEALAANMNERGVRNEERLKFLEESERKKR